MIPLINETLFQRKMSDNNSSGDEDLKGWEEDYEKEFNKELECDGPISNGGKIFKPKKR